MFIFSSIIRIIEKILFWVSGVDQSEIFSFGVIGSPQNYFLKKIIKKYQIDLIHLHWGGVGYFPLKSIKGLNQKFLVTTHDYHYLTGGCHIPMDCEQYLNDCINCPLVTSSFIKEIVRKNRVENKKLANLENVKIIAPSTYTKALVEKMQGEKIAFVPNTFGRAYSGDEHDIDELILKYRNYKDIHSASNTLIAVGVNGSERNNKGQDILSKVIDNLCKQGRGLILITIGEWFQYSDKLIEHINLSQVSTLALKDLYAISDLCLVPSRYETFSQVTLESIMCCTPVVAFDLSGPRDILGEAYPLLAKSFDAGDFINIVANNLNYKKDNLDLLRKKALEASSKYAPNKAASLTSKI
jgi:glycosyltransferase involved in cell wall biosynthesis